MPRFFVKPQNITEKCINIYGDDAVHISKSLRMKKGDEITLCDGQSFDYFCEISNINSVEICCNILKKEASMAEPSVNVSLYVALSKADKLELVTQKAVELGVFEIIPFVSARCISRPDDNKMEKKRERLSKISYEAAKQSGRGYVPCIGSCLSFSNALEDSKKNELSIFLYENEQNLTIKSFLSDKKFKSISVFIGPEGGFEPNEVSKAHELMPIVSLGKRILRCETAPLAALSAIMYQSDNF